MDCADRLKRDLADLVDLEPMAGDGDCALAVGGYGDDAAGLLEAARRARMGAHEIRGTGTYGRSEDECGGWSGEHPTFSGDDGVKFKGGSEHEEAAGSEMWRRLLWGQDVLSPTLAEGCRWARQPAHKRDEAGPGGLNSWMVGYVESRTGISHGLPSCPLPWRFCTSHHAARNAAKFPNWSLWFPYCSGE